MTIILPSFSDDEEEEERKPVVVEQKPLLDTVDASTHHRHNAIAQRHIGLLKENPYTEAQGQIMEDKGNRLVVTKIMNIASQTHEFISGDRDIDTDWLIEQLRVLIPDTDRRGNMNYCAKYLVRFAEIAVNEALAKQHSNEVIYRKIRELRLKENERDRVQYRDRSSSSSSSRKRHAFSSIQQPKYEYEYKMPTMRGPKAEEEEDPDRYFRDSRETDTDLFAKSPSPPPLKVIPSEQRRRTETVRDGKAGTFQYRQSSSAGGTGGIPIRAPIEKPRPAPPPPEPQVPTRRQQIREEMSGYIRADALTVFKPGRTGRADQQQWEQLEVATNAQQQVDHSKQKTRRPSVERRTPVPRMSNSHSQFMRSRQQHQQRNDVADRLDVSCSAAESEEEEDEEDDNDDDVVGYSPPCSFKSMQCSSGSSIVHVSSTAGLGLKSCIRRSKIAKRQIFDPNVVEPRITVRTERITKPRFTTSIFTEQLQQQFNNLSLATPSADHTLMKTVPSLDVPIKVQRRGNPLIEKNSTEIDKLIDEIYGNVFPSKVFTNRKISRLLIADSIIERLKNNIFVNMEVFDLCYPRMPVWFLQALDKWWKGATQHHFRYSKIFIMLGMDLTIYFAHPQGKIEEVVIRFLEDLAHWFAAKLAKVQRSQRELGQESPFYPKYDKENVLKLPDGSEKMVYVRTLFPRLTCPPELVVVTVPEVGSFHTFFEALNNRLRQFVRANSDNFSLLDWAAEVKNLPGEQNNVEGRMAKLIEVMRSEHAVIYK